MSLFFQRSCITFPISTGDPGSPAAGLRSPPGHITGCSWNAHETVTDSGNSDDTMTVPRREPPGIPAEVISGGKEKMKKMNNLNILKLENAVLQKQIDVVRRNIRAGQNRDLTREEVEILRGVGEHYAKKWDVLYPMLKQGYGAAGWVKQMKMEEDEIVAELRSLVRFPDKEEWEEKVEAVLRKMERMIYEEDYMLYPNCLQFFRRGEGIWMNRSDRDGYANYRALRTKVGRYRRALQQRSFR